MSAMALAPKRQPDPVPVDEQMIVLAAILEKAANELMRLAKEIGEDSDD